MSSSGLIYAVIVGAWAAYLVPMWLRRQDELNEARPTERFSTAIRLLSGRAGMERRYAKDLRARSTEEGEPSADATDAVTDSVDVRAFAMPPVRPQVHAPVRQQSQERPEAAREPERGAVRESERAAAREAARESEHAPPVREPAREQAPKSAPQQAPASARAPKSPSASARKRVPVPRRSPAEEAAAARARRVKVLARRRRTTVMLFLAFTLGAIVAAVGGLALLWAPGVPAVLLSGYIAYLRTQERRRFAYQMDRRRAEVAAQRLRERQPRRRASVDASLDDAEEGPEPETDPGLSALAADRRALVEQTDHAEWVDQQRERQRRPGQGDSWDPVPVPLPTYVTAPVAPRATSDVDLGAPDAWSSARSSSVAPEQEAQSGARDDRDARDAQHAHDVQDDDAEDGSEDRTTADGRTDARRAASARRARERGRTPLFDQYEDGERPRAANE
ncbi:divisome protein SepX/GlpR [Streptomyces sp. NBC_00696]|uniref:divisome protein SepX/GlpR n=1 Tax=Streptomyces sp. NBC_00696 TaxID=2903672 RepID=UPI002E327FC8|nr:gephyrin-like molybdotransferase receptor GlpR [Streptomyces sp. NBC_00696]